MLNDKTAERRGTWHQTAFRSGRERGCCSLGQMYLEPPGFLVLHITGTVLLSVGTVMAIALREKHEICQWLALFFGLSLGGTLVSLRGLFVQSAMAALPVQAGMVHEEGARYSGTAAVLVFLGLVMLLLGMESMRRHAQRGSLPSHWPSKPAASSKS